MLGDLAHVVVASLHTQTSETQRRLSSTSVLLGKINAELVDHLARVTGESTVENTVSVHDDEAKLGVGLEELRESVSVELVIAEVKGLRGESRISWCRLKRGAETRTVLMAACGNELAGLQTQSGEDARLKGSKSKLTFFSLPSSVRIVPQ